MISPFTKSHEVGSILRQPLFLPKLSLEYKRQQIFEVLHLIAYICIKKKKKAIIHTIPMKHIYSLFLFFFILSFVCCEKPVIDDSENKKENNDKVNGSTSTGNNGDNGGWANGDGKNDTEWVSTDTVDVYTFKNHVFEGPICVKGYIVGCATSTGGYKYFFDSPYESSTSILIADDKNEKSKSNVIAIQLKNGSKIRRDLNLVDNPGNIQRLVAIYGYQTKYMKMTGMKEILSYELK